MASVGQGRQANSDWLKQSEVILELLFKHRNQLYSVHVHVCKMGEHRWVSRKWKFNQASRDAWKTMRDAKKLSFQTKASEVQQSIFSGKIVWNSIRDMQHGRRGLIPVRSPAVQDEMAALALCYRNSHRDGGDTSQVS